ncbi:MAG: RIP metalloprotease RseP [Microscillaceae bacterium]|nr:RIP metalloprotease RseP [Microscillaceae bacterium]
MGTFIMIAQLLLGLSIIVGLHELGHLLTAKLFKMRVERFSIGFPPRIFGVRWGETRYELGAIPMGGFVKISGMIDESFDTKHLKEEPQDYEFRAKPAWQRLIVMMGGILVNIFTGILMFIGIVYYWGDSYIPASEMQKHGIVAYELAREIGLKTGDKILAVNGQKIQKYEEILSAKTLLESNSYYTIERNGKKIDIPLPNDLVERLSGRNQTPRRFIEMQLPFEVGQVIGGRPAAKAGMQEGDQIVGFNEQKIRFFHELKDLQDKNKGKTIRLTLLRQGKTRQIQLTTQKDGTIGFFPKFRVNYQQIEYSLAEATTKGTADAFGSVVNNIKGFGKIFRGEVSTRALSGPIGIAQIFGTNWDWFRFWQITAVLSMWLAFLNFLPIPALDGGHVMFLSYEIISGHKPSDRFLTNAQTVGVLLLLGLMVFVIFNDIFNLFF